MVGRYLSLFFLLCKSEQKIQLFLSIFASGRANTRCFFFFVGEGTTSMVFFSFPLQVGAQHLDLFSSLQVGSQNIGCKNLGLFSIRTCRRIAKFDRNEINPLKAQIKNVNNILIVCCFFQRNISILAIYVSRMLFDWMLSLYTFTLCCHQRAELVENCDEIRLHVGQDIPCSPVARLLFADQGVGRGGGEGRGGGCR